MYIYIYAANTGLLSNLPHNMTTVLTREFYYETSSTSTPSSTTSILNSFMFKFTTHNTQNHFGADFWVLLRVNIHTNDKAAHAQIYHTKSLTFWVLLPDKIETQTIEYYDVAANSWTLLENFFFPAPASGAAICVL